MNKTKAKLSDLQIRKRYSCLLKISPKNHVNFAELLEKNLVKCLCGFSFLQMFFLTLGLFHNVLSFQLNFTSSSLYIYLIQKFDMQNGMKKLLTDGFI